MATKKRKKKEKLSTRIWNWYKENREQIECVALGVCVTVIPGVVSYIYGEIDGQEKGYRDGISDFAGTVPAIMDYCGSVGAQAEYDALCDQFPEMRPEGTIRIDAYKSGKQAYHYFHEDEGVKNILKQMDNAKKKNW